MVTPGCLSNKYLQYGDVQAHAYKLGAYSEYFATHSISNGVNNLLARVLQTYGDALTDGTHVIMKRRGGGDGEKHAFS